MARPVGNRPLTAPAQSRWRSAQPAAEMHSEAARLNAVDLASPAISGPWARVPSGGRVHLGGLSELGLSELGLSELGLSELGLSELGLSELGLSELGLSELGLS
jgi:hypothetical protein